MQRQLHQHALGEVADRRHEDGAAGEAGVAHDFRNVLVREAERIDLYGGGWPFSYASIMLRPPPE